MAEYMCMYEFKSGFHHYIISSSGVLYNGNVNKKCSNFSYACILKTPTKVFYYPYLPLAWLQALRLSSAARQTTTTGEIANLMSVDAQKLEGMCSDIHEVWAAPVTLLIGMVFLWQIFGLSTLAGVAALILLVPVNGGALAKLFIGYQVFKRVSSRCSDDFFMVL